MTNVLLGSLLIVSVCLFEIIAVDFLYLRPQACHSSDPIKLNVLKYIEV